FMRVFFQGFRVADAIVARAGVKDIAESKRTQGGVSTRTSSSDHQAVAIYFAFLHQKARPVDAVVNVHNSPLAFQSLSIGAPKTGAASVVHVKHGDSPAGPILDDQTLCCGRSSCWS